MVGMDRLVSYYYKFRMWGVRGMVDFLKNAHAERKVRRFFAVNAKRYPYETPEKGITVIGNLSKRGSLDKTLRDFVFSLRDAGIPYQTFDLGAKEVPSEDVAPILTPRSEFRIGRYSHVVEMVRSPLQEGIVRHQARIAFWEFETGLLEAFPTLIDRAGDVIAMSDFNYNYFKVVLKGRRGVHKLLYPLRIETNDVLSKIDARKRFGLSPEDFVVFYNFSYSSGWGRKNPLGVLQAFAAAFPNERRAKLVFKTSFKIGLERRESQLREFAREKGVTDRVVFVDDYLTQKDVFNLTNACDVYVSLHRAEGFGLGVAEAMSLGKAVVVTNYSSTTEFCNEDNSLPVRCSLVKMRDEHRDLVWFVAADKWAEPDVLDAAEKLRMLYGNPQLLERIGARAKASIREQFSIERFRVSVERFLSETNHAIP